jgi:7-cyano-7-deazaguanine synthase
MISNIRVLKLIFSERREYTMKKAIITISGGIDSTTTAALAKRDGYGLYFLTVNYGQKNLERELANTKFLAEYYGAEQHKVVDMLWLGALGKSGITDDTIKFDTKNDDLIYVPFRNACILSCAIAWAEVDSDVEKIFIGSEAGPWICPDNSPEFISIMNELAHIATKSNVTIEAPLNFLDKEGIIKLALELKVPLEHTWTCVACAKKQCGVCQPCRNRRDTFLKLGLVDPVEYEE